MYARKHGLKDVKGGIGGVRETIKHLKTGKKLNSKMFRDFVKNGNYGSQSKNWKWK